ncbi:hypothetical protein CH352_16315 [Leptospira hartskeerlii]|uniref:DUF819 domain-containing protein n=1 Tax=Leptospira hartskeerlii TaxID=2023177 RepID=A0A2M9X9F3_9LEPT|nr:DUF819 family protein [Leptospira hartskeerlii]PJZ24323.1 hypothetical protein CH357_16810 [Leptospira hartskeerlii]PJZ32508.1 hypothetical protein CH352_16315 [Leptospira hartskeerlii]
MSEVFHWIISVLFLGFILGFPWLAGSLSKKHKWLGFLGPVVLCYASGIILGNLIPSEFLPKKIAESVSEISIPIAIPLLLASSDFGRGIKEARLALFSFFLSCIAVAISSVSVGFFLSSLHPESSKIGGMLAGLYTGGTPNSNAIGLALDAGKATIALVNTVDLLIGGTYLLFLLSFSKKVYSIFLKPEVVGEVEEGAVSEAKVSPKNPVVSLLLGIVLSILGLGASLGISQVIFGTASAPFILLGITTWGIGISFSKKVRSLDIYPVGYYFILIFSVAIGFLADFGSLVKGASGVLLIVLATMSIAILLHLIFGILFKIPVDTWIITSVSSIYGPAFVPSVAAAIGNKGVLILGILTGLIGYAVGNYLGLAVYWFLAR